MLNINNVDHLNMNVTNLKNSQDFYQKLFGLKVFEEGTSSSGNAYSIVGLPNKVFLCLYEGKETAKKQTLNHFGINIEDFDQAIESLQKESIPLLYGGVIQYEKSKSAYIADPDGNEIELSEAFGGGFN